jgi:hypothetical protein
MTERQRKRRAEKQWRKFHDKLSILIEMRGGNVSGVLCPITLTQLKYLFIALHPNGIVLRVVDRVGENQRRAAKRV